MGGAEFLSLLSSSECPNFMHASKSYPHIINFPLLVRDAYEGDIIRTLMGTEMSLMSINLLIADRDRPLALAGVVGGLDSSVKEDTCSILLESAFFDPYRIRKSARSLALQTDSSYRFERNVDIEGVKRAPRSCHKAFA